MDIKVDKNTVVVFDLDDTLYNEFDYLKSAYQQIARKLEPVNHQTLFSFMISLYRSKENVFEIIEKRYQISKASLIDMYRYHDPQIKIFDGALAVLEGIKNKKGKIAIVTDGRSRTQMSKINALKISDLVDKIVISEEIGTEKPSLSNFKIVEEYFSGNAYCYIADNLKKDFIAPNILGWKTIGLIDNGLNIHHESYLYLNKKHMPQKFITSFSEVRIV